jgi:mono/diheme cytochrome c family protein
VVGCTLGLARSTDAQTTDKPAKAPESPPKSADTQATDKPAQLESSNPFSGDPKAIASGRDLYFTWCAQCHGKNADGVSPRWGKYAKDLRKFWQGYGKFLLIVVQGVKGKQMPPWGEVLSGNQISQIGAYLETLAMEGANWK